jgi:hypothetical protein
MRSLILYAISAVASAIKSKSTARTASHAMVDAMVRSLAREMPKNLAQVAESSAELKTLIETSYESWYEMVYAETIERLEIEDPLPEFCDQAAGCSKEIETRVKKEIETIWQEVFVSVIAPAIKSTTTTTNKIIEESWKDRMRCGFTYPCCTYGPEFQYNVKEMMRHAKKGMYGGFDHFYEME